MKLLRKIPSVTWLRGVRPRQADRARVYTVTVPAPLGADAAAAARREQGPVVTLRVARA